MLTTEHHSSRYKIPVLVKRQDPGTAYGPQDILQMYHLTQPAAHFVERFGRFKSGEALEACRLFLAQWPDGPQL